MVSGAASFADTGQIGPKESGAQMLEWRGSDGSASRRPAGVSYVENKDRDGNVNYYRAVRDTEEASVSWRCEIGTYIAEALGLPSGKVYWMKGWPSGYGFYDHQKGQLPNPRHDLYLCGSPTTVRFRSKNEFKPHAKWLMTDPTLNPRNCGCKYCTKTKSQVEVNQVQGLSGLQRPPEHHLRGTHSTPGETMTHARRKIIREKMKEEKAKSTKRSDLPLTALPERLRDLNSDRMFRPFELVWVALQEPISIDESRSIAIEFWPAIILSYVTKNEPTPHKPGDTNYNIISRYSFTIRLLGVNHQVSVPEERLLPQLGYVPNDDLLSAVKDCEPSRPLDPQFTEYARFNPLPEFDSTIPIAPGSYTKEDALPAYCLALHIVACLTPVWSATHSYSSDDKGVQSDDLFQGLWWGSERIWLDDLVRLRPSRDELDPENSLGLLHPSSPDASTRPLLLRLTYIVVDQEDPSGMSICVGGDLYELAEAETKHQPAGPQSGQPTRQSIFGPPTGLLGPSDLVPAPVAGTSSSSGAKTGPALAESPIAMPPPPPGFTFRKLLSQGSEMIVDVGAIAGRYYPKLLQDDTLNLVRRTVKQDTNVRPGESIVGTVDGYTRERVRRAQNSPESGAIDELTPLLALVGLYLGEGNVMQPEQWAKGRMQTIRGSETNGRRVLYEQWTKLASGSSDVEMVDP